MPVVNINDFAIGTVINNGSSSGVLFQDGSVIGQADAFTFDGSVLRARSISSSNPVGGTGINNERFGIDAGVSLTTGGYNTIVGHDAGYYTTTGTYNTYVGYQSSYYAASGHYNIAVGSFALKNNLSGLANVAVGYASLLNNTVSTNTAVGHAAGNINSTGTGNVYMGYFAGYYQTTGLGNVIVGVSAGYGSIGSAYSYNTIIGGYAGYKLETGSQNVAVGAYALDANTSGGKNIAIGYLSLSDNNGSSNVGVGYASLNKGIGVDCCTAIGHESLYNNTFDYNTAIGYRALYNNTTGAGNTGVGTSVGYNNITGDYNTLFGYNTGYSILSGTSNTLIGYAAGYNISTTSNNTVIGYGAMYYNTSYGNTVVGMQAGGSINHGSTSIYTYSVYMGYRAGYYAFNSSNNVAIGSFAHHMNKSGAGNIMVGHAAGYSASGSYNNYVGYQTGYHGTTSHSNLAMGSQSLFYNKTGLYNVALGHGALIGGVGESCSNTVAVGKNAGAYCRGDNNTLVGTDAGNLITTGTDNICIGYSTDPTAAGSTNQLNIGNSIYGDLSTDYISLGTTDTDKSKLYIWEGGISCHNSSSDNYIHKHSSAAQYYEIAANVTGVLVIGSDDAAGLAAVCQYKITGYHYGGYGAWEVIVGAYWYPTLRIWINTTVEMRGTVPFDRVRLLHEDDKPRIILGDVDTVWQYPCVNMDMEVAGYVSGGAWVKGWSITRSATLNASGTTESASVLEPNIPYRINPTNNVFAIGPQTNGSIDTLSKLHVSDDGNCIATIQGDGAASSYSSLQLRNSNSSNRVLLSKLNRDHVSLGNSLYLANVCNGSTTGYMVVSSGGDINLLPTNARVGISTLNPTSLLHISENTSSVTNGLTIEQDGTGDSICQFLLTGARRWVVGIDNSDSDKFKIASTSDLSSDVVLTADVDGNIGIGTTTPQHPLHILDTVVSGDATVVSVRNTSGTSGAAAKVVLPVFNGAPGLQIIQSSYAGGGTAWETVGSENYSAIIRTGQASSNLHFAAGGSSTTPHITIKSNDNVGINNTSPKTSLHSTGDTIIGVASGSVIDSYLNNEECAFKLDETNNKLKFRVRYSDGSYKIGEVALV